MPRYVKSRLLQPKDLADFVPEFLQFCVTVSATILHSCHNSCHKPPGTGIPTALVFRHPQLKWPQIFQGLAGEVSFYLYLPRSSKFIEQHCHLVYTEVWGFSIDRKGARDSLPARLGSLLREQLRDGSELPSSAVTAYTECTFILRIGSLTR